MSRTVAAAAVLSIVAVTTAGSAQATVVTHDFCHNDGTSVTLPSGGYCRSGGEHLLYNVYTFLVSAPAGTTIYCGAELSGVTYGTYNSGPDDCSHNYLGTHELVASTYVVPGATVHGLIRYEAP
jgi:hypothetical protein